MPYHVHLVSPSNEDSTYIKPLWVATLADAYRTRGSKVVLGGIHVTALPEEGLGHADAVVSGEAEWLWGDVLRDARAGRLGSGRSLVRRAIYKDDDYRPLAGLVLPRRE